MDLNGLAAAGGAAVLLSIVVSAGLFLLGLWLTYTVIWRAVRRGLREFNDDPTRTVHLHR
jgi:hypothetical protein